MDTFADAIARGEHVVAESGTGTGKTICALVPALEDVLENGRKVLYLTRTNSQQAHVIHELRTVADHRKGNTAGKAGKGTKDGTGNYTESHTDCETGSDTKDAAGGDIFGIALQGRQHMCPLMKDGGFENATSEELSRLCSRRKRNTLRMREAGMKEIDPKRGCIYYHHLISRELQDETAWIREYIPSPEDLYGYAHDRELCPYELTKKMLPDAQVVAAPYVYFFEGALLVHLLEWMQVSQDRLTVIIDEAHNLPDYARDISSDEETVTALKLAAEEAKDWGPLRIGGALLVEDLCDVLTALVHETVEDYCSGDDGLVPPYEFEARVLSFFTINSNVLKLWIGELITHGSIIKDRKLEKGRIPRSYIHHLGMFLQEWLEVTEDYYVHLVNSGSDASGSPTNPSLEIYCLDPSRACRELLHCHATISMSGTLVPLEAYRDNIGLPRDRTRREIFPSPFPPGNRRIAFAGDVTTKYEVISGDAAVRDRMRTYIRTLANFTVRDDPGRIPNIAVFFPSHAQLARMMDDELENAIRKDCFIERRGMAQREIMELVDNFKRRSAPGAEKGVLLSVMGGRISEGMDFPGSQLEMVVVVGIPYPRPTAKQRSLMNYNEHKFRKGWEYTVKAPAHRRIMQTIGRLIRNENDRGMAVILDSRAVHFPIDSLVECRDLAGVARELDGFFGSSGNAH